MEQPEQIDCKKRKGLLLTGENDSSEILMDHPLRSRQGRQITNPMFHNILAFRLLQD